MSNYFRCLALIAASFLTMAARPAVPVNHDDGMTEHRQGRGGLDLGWGQAEDEEDTETVLTDEQKQKEVEKKKAEEQKLKDKQSDEDFFDQKSDETRNRSELD